MDLTLTFELKDTTAKEGSKSSGDSFKLQFKRKREESIIIENEEIDLLSTFQHFWNKDVEATISRKNPLQGAFNETLSFVGRVTNTDSKIVTKMAIQEFDIMGEYDVDFASKIENYRWKELYVTIKEVQPEMNENESYDG